MVADAGVGLCGLCVFYRCLRRAQAARLCLRETLWGVTAELSGSSALGADEAVSYADLNYAKFVRARAALVLEPCPPR